MKGKLNPKLGSVILLGIFLCVIFAGVVEAAEVKERNNVEVAYTETEIIESTYTDKWRNRIFRIENGANEITATVWGSNDEETWEYWDSTTIDAYDNDNMVMGRNHWWYIKLTGHTNEDPLISIVDASLAYHEP
jgi:hypothetical protein